MLTCKLCKKKFNGRRDKIFCSTYCKNDYHTKLRAVTNKATTDVDKILHRNRSILLETLTKKGVRKKIPRIDLDQKNFNYDYITGYHVNKQGKVVHQVYDFYWLIFSDEEVYIYRKTKVG